MRKHFNKQNHNNPTKSYQNALRNNGGQWHSEANGEYVAQTDTLYRVVVEMLHEAGSLQQYKPRQIWNAANNHNAFPTDCYDDIIVVDDAAAVMERL